MEKKNVLVHTFWLAMEDVAPVEFHQIFQLDLSLFWANYDMICDQ